MKNPSNLKYRMIVKKLISESFPTLKNRRIFVYESSGPWYNADTLQLLLFSVIRIKPHLRNISDRVKTGLLAHELCHLETFYERGFISTLIDEIRYLLSENFYKKVERETDRKVIKKGYRKELKDFKKFANSYLKDNKKYQRLYVKNEK